MDDWGYEGFKYKKEVIKREGISLAEAQKKAEWSKLVNNNLQVWQQSEPVNIMHYQYSSWIPLNRITKRKRGNGVTKISHRHRRFSSSSSRTWRAKTVKESSKGEGHSSINTVQLIATIFFFVCFFTVY